MKEKNMETKRIISNDLFLFRYIWKFAPGFLVQEIINAVLSGAVGSMFTIYTKLFYDAISEQKEMRYVLILSGIVMAIDVLTSLYFIWYRTTRRECLLLKLKYAMNRELFEVTRRLDLSCYDNTEFYDAFIWTMGQSGERTVGMVDSLVSMIRNGVRIVTVISILTSVDWRLTLAAAAAAILSIMLGRKEMHINVRKSEVLTPLQRRGAYYERIFSRPDTAKEIRVSRVSELILKKYDDTIEDIERTARQANVRTIPYALSGEILLKLTEPLVYIFLLYQVMVNGSAELGGLAVAVSSFWGLRNSLEDVLNTVLRFEEHALYAEKMRRLLEYKNTLRSGDLPYEPLDTITFRNVCFGYTAEKEILHNINITIRRGEKIALVGYNGAGKTTLIKLLLHLYDPTEGEILVNGKNICTYDTDSYRQHICTVFQDFRIFALSIAENVYCDIVTPSDLDAVYDALEKAAFTEKLQKLPNGLRTELTREFYEDGTDLSGGESQKIAAARIFAHPFEWIVMDEPSSALDPEAEYTLNQRISRYACGKTVISISHRLSTTRDADRIYMFENGCIVEEGSHDELMAQNGEYAEMFRVQAKKYS